MSSNYQFKARKIGVKFDLEYDYLTWSGSIMSFSPCSVDTYGV